MEETTVNCVVWESNLLDKSSASNIELLCKSKIRQG